MTISLHPTGSRAAQQATGGRCPADRDETGAWLLRGHDDVVAAALDPGTFSNRYSHHLKVPNGLDGAEHARCRELIDRYLTPARVAALEPRIRQVAADLARSLPAGEPVEVVSELGARFAVRAQSAWLGWPAALEGELLRWIEDNHEATRSRDPDRTAAVAARFDAIIATLIEARRGQPPTDVTGELLDDRIDGRPLSDAEVTSILRNWTAGDLGSIAACVGVIVHRLAVDRDLQESWRGGATSGAELEAGIDEILRIDNPFPSSRRVTTGAVEIGGGEIGAGEIVRLDWAAANRDPTVVGDPDAYRPLDNATHNLVYGIGPHVCPGRGLATMELRAAIEELLAASGSIALAPGAEPVREEPPRGGYRTVPVLLSS